MKKYSFNINVNQEFDTPISKHAFLLRCMPGTYPFQRSYAHKLVIKPYTALTHIHDVYGNELCSGTIDKAHSSFSFSASGFVLSSKYLIHENMDRLYLYPTALTQPAKGMEQLANYNSLPENPWTRAQMLCTLTYRLINFTPNSEHRTAAEAFAAGDGDAKDFAHVLIALCRLNGIPCRFVSGLAVGIPTFHCWVEVFCNDVWRALDPCSGIAVEEGYLKISHGPDYDACVLQRGYFKECDTPYTQNIQVRVAEHVIRTRDTVPHA